MKFVITLSFFSLTILLANRCCSSESVLKRLTDESTSYIMPQHVDDTKPAFVYSSSGQLAFTITNDLKRGFFDIKDSQGKTVVDAVPRGGRDCKRDYTYAINNRTANFALGPTGQWQVANKGTIYKLSDKPKNHSKGPYERELSTGNGAIDTIITTSPTSSSDMNFHGVPINTIRRSTTSACPLEYTIALLLVMSKREAQCGES